ncbi:MAG: hypothetical protein HOC70_14070 [Gammaproteobacteria bacterium]|jgi:phospholipid transport system substrate-binding protein|nr:hypothetical protein [Gammaproteobacteria bacterium]MBT4494364.1 hypothetical protein [Gammaproteobacteria bacterium]
MTHRLVTSALVALALTTSTVSADTDTPDTDTPDKVITAFHGALIAAMKTGPFNERFKIVAPAIRDHFQLQTISRISLGKNWRELAPEQQSSYRALMEELIATTYTSRFDKFDNQEFSTLSLDPISEKRMRIRTRLVTKSETVSLDYQLRATDEGWRIYDIVANGVSDLALKRSNYAAIFADGGLESVKTDIRISIAKNREEKPD